MKINLTPQRAEAIIARCLPKVQGQNEALSYSVKGISVLGEKMDFYTPETPIEKIRKDMGNATKDIIIFNHNEDTTGKGTLAKILLAAREEGKLGKIKYPETYNEPCGSNLICKANTLPIANSKGGLMNTPCSGEALRPLKKGK